MKCALCNNEAEHICDCLVIENTTNKTVVSQTYQSKTIRTEKAQRAKGVEKVGLCEKHLNKRKGAAEKFACSTYLPMLLAAVGMILMFIGMYGKAKGGGNPSLETAGGIIMMTGIAIQGVIIFILVPIRNKKLIHEKPWKAFPQLRIKNPIAVEQEGTIELLVPLGEGYYADEKDFNDTNSLLLKDTQKRIYEQYISTGRWKELIGAPAADISLTNNNGNNIESASLLALVMMFREKPEGYEGMARGVGQKLLGEGGSELMRNVYYKFSLVCPEHAKDLEQAWNGIGSWQE